MEQIIFCLKKRYSPVGLICYGSYCDGTQNQYSDFDALLICEGGEYHHDTSVIEGVRMDVFVYPQDQVNQLDADAFLQIFDGKILLDETGAAGKLMRQVRQYVDNTPRKSAMEKEELRGWCMKMLQRCQRQDPEGLYRAHWLAFDSLQIYCDMRDLFYFGPKKTILRMQEADAAGYQLFCDAMKDITGLGNWIQYIFDKS